MGYRPRKWPDYALGALESSRKLAKHVKATVRAAQKANIEGNRDMVMVLLADIREANAQIDELLAGAYHGEYVEGEILDE